MEKQGWPKPADWMQRQEYPGPVVELTAEEKRAFGEIGIDMDEFQEADIDSGPFEQARVDFRRLVTKGSFGITEVAKNLNHAPSTIRRWIGDRRLFAVWHRGRWRVPSFQFMEGGTQLVPGIDQVNRDLPADWHPIAISNWFQLPNPDCEIADRSVSPVEWLSSAKDPMPVVRLAEVLDYPM